MEQKPYRFIGTRSGIAGKGGFQRYGQRLMLTDEEADRFVFRRGGVPAVPETDWEKTWKGFSVELPHHGKVGVDHFDEPASHSGAPQEFGDRKDRLAAKYRELVEAATAKRIEAKSKPAAPAAPPPLPPKPAERKEG